MDCKCPKDWLDILSVISTPSTALAIGFITVYIAWRQWRTAELKRKQDLFDKRYLTYQAMKEYINEMYDYFANYNPDLPNSAHYNEIVRKVWASSQLFLFNIDIEEYLKEMGKQSEQLDTKISIIYFNEQRKKIDKKFDKYLRIKEAC